MSKNKQITDIQQLQDSLEQVYKSTKPEIIQEYLMIPSAAEDRPKFHRVTGCKNCPFKQITSTAAGFPSQTSCYWDGTNSNLSEYILQENTTPSQCPLKQHSVGVLVKLTQNTDGNKE